jgi:DHA1 family inner membrane transport protein
MSSLASAGATRSNLALAALALGAFAIGTAELVVVGILNLIATDTSVSVSSAGQLVTAYALGIAIGAPLLTVLTGRFGRRLVLRLSLVAFVAGNALAVGATSFHMLLLARVITGSIHGLFIGVASVIAAGLVATEHRGQAISMVFGGIAVFTVVGGRVGTLIGQTLGWRAAFVAVFILAVVALVASLLFIRPVGGRSSGKLCSQARAAFAPGCWACSARGCFFLQLRVINLAGTGGDLASTLGASAVNAGIAAGSLIGGLVLARHGAAAPLVVAVILCALAIPVTWATRFFTPPAAAPGKKVAAAGLDGSGLRVPGLGTEGA